MSAATFSDIIALRNTNLLKQVYFKDTFKSQMSHVQDYTTSAMWSSAYNDDDNIMRIVFETKAAIHVRLPWYG